MNSLTAISQASKADLKFALIDDNIENISELKKSELVELVRNKFLNNSTSISVEEELEDSVILHVEGEDENEDSYEEDGADESDIDIGPNDPDWTEYVLSLLHDHEKIDKKPRADGLRRVFGNLIGTITETEVQVAEAATPDNEGRATVIFSMSFVDNRTGHLLKRSDASDSSYRNTKRPYSAHPTATAVTMAEGRCLRKAMGLNVITNEESLGEDNSPENVTFVTTKVAQILSSFSNRLSINLPNLLIHLDLMSEEQKDESLESFLPLADGQQAMRQLNRYNRSPEDKDYLAIPEKILKDFKDDTEN